MHRQALRDCLLCMRHMAGPRTGVQNLIKQYRKKEEALLHERERLEQMKTYERQHADCALICGIDEAGRG